MLFILIYRMINSMEAKKDKKLALVLSGGGIKAAAFHVGVSLALREHGYYFAGGSCLLYTSPSPRDCQ